MTWARFEDNFAEHPKVIGLSDAAFRLHVTAICYSARYQTDGEVTPAAFRAISGKPKLADELVDAGLWDTTSRGGWAVHDYLEYNPSREKVTQRRNARVDAGRVGGQRSGATRRSKTEANDEAFASRLLEPKTNPVPSRPVPETYNPPGYASLSAAEREIADTALSKLPLQYQRDELAIDELGQFARDFASRPHVHRELAEAIAKCRQNGVLCFAGNLRKYMPGGQHGSNTRVGTSANPSPRRQQLIDAGIVER